MTLPMQFSIFLIIIAFIIYFIFWKELINLGNKINKRFKKIKDEIGRNDK